MLCTYGLTPTFALRGIRLLDGEGGAGGGATPPAAPSGAAGAANPPTPAPTPAPTPPAAPQRPAGENVADLPEWAQKIINETRQEAAGHRTAKNTVEQQLQQFKDAAAVTLGLKQADQQDPAALATALKAAQDTARENAVRLGIYQHAGAHGGDANALLDSASFLRSVATLDPTAGDFPTSISAAIKNAVEANPHLKTVRATGASSVQLPAGGSGEGGPITEAQLSAMTAEQVVEAHTKGLLNHLL